MHHGSLYKKELYLVKGVVVFLKIMKLWKPLPGVGQVLESHTFKAYLAKPKMEEKGTKEDEMAGWHHRLDGREFEWTSGDGDGQGGLACCNSWGRKESDMTERLNWSELKMQLENLLCSQRINFFLASDNSWFKKDMI